MTSQEIMIEAKNEILSLNAKGYSISEKHAEEKAKSIATWVSGAIQLNLDRAVYFKWQRDAPHEDRETVTRSLDAREVLSRGGYHGMSRALEAMLRQEFPTLPDEAYLL